MTDTVKFLTSEIALTTANNVSSANVVRLINTDNTTASTITQKTSGGATIATFTLGTRDSNYGCIFVMKQPSHTLEASGGTVKAVSVAYY
jgi:hypothetical protein